MKLTENIHIVGGGLMGFGLSHMGDCHVYAVTDGEETALIDAGVGMEPERIVANVEADGIDPDTVKYLILTHCHGDHAGGAAFLRKQYRLEVISPVDTRVWLETADEDATNLARARAAGRYPASYRLEPVAVAREVDDGEEIRVGSLRLHTFSTPGHAGRHMSYLLEADDKKYLFGGDLVFAGGLVVLNWAEETSVFELGNSITRFRDAGIDALLPGHAAIALENGQAHIDKAIAKFDSLTVPRNMME